MTVEEKVARKFAELMEKEIGIEDLREAVERNAAETSPNVCHTHDFCDANMVMADAFEQCGLSATQDEPSIELWNVAWELAVKNKFWIKETDWDGFR